MSTIKKKVPQYKKGFKKISTELLDYFESGNTEGETLDLFVIRTDRNKLQSVWNEHKGEILEKWIKEYPGFRPFAWWKFESPEIRKRIGGTGLPSWEAGNSVKSIFYKGIPSDWSCVISGKIILRNFDIEDPPCYESEASYLQRHKFLTSAEEKYLIDFPEAFEPEAITEVMDF